MHSEVCYVLQLMFDLQTNIIEVYPFGIICLPFIFLFIDAIPRRVSCHNKS